MTRLLRSTLATLACCAALATPLRAADDAPFWTGQPNAGRFATMQKSRLDQAKAAIARMVAVKGKRTIENTLRPYDEALLHLDASGSQASLIENVHPDSALRVAAEKVSQETSSYGTDLSLNRAVYEALLGLDLAGADAETRHYVTNELRDFRLAGVDKDEATRQRVKALNEELVLIGQEFQRNIREDVRTIQVAPAELAGLPEDFLKNHPPGADGKVTLDINYPDYQPTMTYARDAAVRQRLYMEFQNRGYPKNVPVLERLIARRHELAGLLGFPSWAEYVTANKMSGNAKVVREFIDRIVAASGPRADREYTMLLGAKRKDDPAAAVVNFWDGGYYTERVGQTEYNFDSQKARPYFPYAGIQQGVLDLAARLFGVTFRRTDAPVWHPSVESWEMLEGGKLVGRFYLDMHPRPDKYNHAAQFDIRTGVAGRQIPEAALVCNLPGGSAGDPGLMEHDDLVTMLHEFGHLLHTLFAGRHRWVGIGGIRTEHDFVEAPSQMLEEWAWDAKVLATFAKHHETGEPIPAPMVEQMKRAKDYGEGLRTRRQMVYADLSLSCYSKDPAQVDLPALTSELVKRYQPFPFVEGTHFECAFGHLDGYSAVYYTYMWSQVIAKDLFSKFDTGNLLDPAVAMRYRQKVLDPGGSKPAAALVEDFLGRPFNFQAFEAWLNNENTAGTPTSRP